MEKINRDYFKNFGLNYSRCTNLDETPLICMNSNQPNAFPQIQFPTLSGKQPYLQSKSTSAVNGVHVGPSLRSSGHLEMFNFEGKKTGQPSTQDERNEPAANPIKVLPTTGINASA